MEILTFIPFIAILILFIMFKISFSLFHKELNKYILLIVFSMFMLVTSGCIPIEDSIYCSECREEYQVVYNFTENLNYTNMCCYPLDCPQSKNNPDVCTCMYMVECLTENEMETMMNKEVKNG